MQTATPTAAVCIAMLSLVSTGAMSAENTVERITLAQASSVCPGRALDSALVAVLLVLPTVQASDALSKPVNRFRYNYLDTATASRPVVTGEIRGFGAPGCTVSFASAGNDDD